VENLQLFDDASRGPWGALQMLLRLKTGGAIASLGAVITIAALAIDPSTQQVLAFPSRSVSMGTGSASIGAAEAYGVGKHTDSDTSALSAFVKMQGAVFGGLFGQSSPLDFTCPTSNCQWPDLMSLAVCASCSDFTNTTVVTCSSLDGVDGGVECTFQTPNRFSLQADNNLGSTTFVAHAKGNVRATKRADQPSYKPAPDAELTPFAAVKVLAFDNSSLSAKAIVSECSFNWCAQIYRQSTSINGSLTVQDTEELPLESVVSGLKPLGLDSPVFHIDKTDESMIQDSLMYMFSTDVTLGFAGFPMTNSTTAQILYTSQNLSQTVKAVAASMTNLVRSSSNSTTVFGEAFQTETFVHVRWGWMTLPVISIILASAMLALTALHSSRHRTALWKSSTLALLFHGLEARQAEELHVDSIGDLQRRAQEMRVELTKSNEGRVALVACEEPAVNPHVRARASGLHDHS